MTDAAPKLYLEDLHVGDRFKSSAHALDEAQIISFAREFDPQPFHVDPEAAKSSLFKGLAASGWHTAAITMRLTAEALPLAGGVIGGTITSLEWPAPTRPDDVLTVQAEILDMRESKSRPDRGIINVRVEARNQRDELRQRHVATLMVTRRPA